MKAIVFFVFIRFSIAPSCFGQVHAVHIPEEKIEEIKFDGELTDWSWIPEDYFISGDNMKDNLNNSKSIHSDWECKIIVAWNDITNWIYIVAIVNDNDFYVRPQSDPKTYYLNDNLEIAIGPDVHSGDYYSRRFEKCYNIIKYYVTPVTKEYNNTVNINAGPQWLINDTSFVKWGYKVNTDKNGKSRIIYELGMAVWEKWSDDGIEASKRLFLQSYQTIRLTLAFNDVDKYRNRRIAQWVTSTGSSKNWGRNISDISVFVLDPPAENQSSWERVYHLFRVCP